MQCFWLPSLKESKLRMWGGQARSRSLRTLKNYALERCLHSSVSWLRILAEVMMSWLWDQDLHWAPRSAESLLKVLSLPLPLPASKINKLIFKKAKKKKKILLWSPVTLSSCDLITHISAGLQSKCSDF